MHNFTWYDRLKVYEMTTMTINVHKMTRNVHTMTINGHAMIMDVHKNGYKGTCLTGEAIMCSFCVIF